MAEFAAVYPWCSPQAFWSLSAADYWALRPYVQARLSDD